MASKLCATSKPFEPQDRPDKVNWPPSPPQLPATSKTFELQTKTEKIDRPPNPPAQHSATSKAFESEPISDKLHRPSTPLPSVLTSPPETKTQTTLAKVDPPPHSPFPGNISSIPLSSLPSYTLKNFNWPSHHPSNTFSSTGTSSATKIHNTLPRSAVAKYYPAGFPAGWEDSLSEALAKTQAEDAARPLVVAATGNQNPKAVLAPAKRDRTRIEEYMPTITEVETPAESPRPEMAALVLERGEVADGKDEGTERE